MKTPRQILPLILFFVVIHTISLPTTAFSQNNGPAIAPSALGATVVSALTNGTPVFDSVIYARTVPTVANGTADYVVLKFRGADQSRLDFQSSSPRKSEIRNNTGRLGGVWVTPDGTQHRFAGHNCLTPAAWFSPVAFAQLISDPHWITYDVGADTHLGPMLHHLRLVRAQFADGSSIATSMQRLGTVDLFVDPSSMVPVIAQFDIHSDTDSKINIPVEVRFSDYRHVSGALVPFRIQKLVQNGLFLDLSVTEAIVNAGLSDLDFSF